MSHTLQETRAVTYHLEIPIDAPPDVVWRSLTEATNAWWLEDFHMTGPESVVTLDAEAGGRLIEHSEGGASLLWYTVQLAVPGASLDLVGHVSAQFGGPATTMLRLALEPHDGGTLLRVTDSLVGHVSDDTVKSLESGWTQLFGEGLKAHAERARQ